MDYSKHFGFVTVRDRHEDYHTLFVHVGEHASDFHSGDHVMFTVGENQKGVAAERAEVIPFGHEEPEDAVAEDDSE